MFLNLGLVLPMKLVTGDTHPNKSIQAVLLGGLFHLISTKKEPGVGFELRNYSCIMQRRVYYRNLMYYFLNYINNRLSLWLITITSEYSGKSMFQKVQEISKKLLIIIPQCRITQLILNFSFLDFLGNVLQFSLQLTHTLKSAYHISLIHILEDGTHLHYQPYLLLLPSQTAHIQVFILTCFLSHCPSV